MNELTAKLILVCKSHYDEATAKFVNEKGLDTIEALRWYLCKYSGTALSYLNVHDVRNALRGAICDYLNSCDNPGQIFLDVFSNIDRGYDDIHAYISALRLVRVRKDATTFVNGFTEELIQPISFFDKEDEEDEYPH